MTDLSARGTLIAERGARRAEASWAQHWARARAGKMIGELENIEWGETFDSICMILVKERSYFCVETTSICVLLKLIEPPKGIYYLQCVVDHY